MGKESWDKFIPHYFTTWLKKSLDSYDFKATLLDFFESDKEASKKLESVDWDTWFYKPGLPPKPKFDTSMVDKCYELAKKWESKVCSQFYNHESMLTFYPGVHTKPQRHLRLDRQPNCRLPRSRPTIQEPPDTRPIPSNGQGLLPRHISQRRTLLPLL